jgi:carboxyl-terminal processing protease
MKRFSLFAAAAVALASLGATSLANAQTPVTVVEYFVPGTALYFITGRANEQAQLDALPAQFKRTGMSFQAASATGTAAPLEAICRYAISVAPTNFVTHFYGVPTDCTAVAAARLPNFANEGLDFAIQRPSASNTCPANAPVAVYRAFRKNTPVDVPNHRYTVSRATYDTMVKRGWAGEGAVFCVATATDETPATSYAAGEAKKSFCEAPRTGVNPRTGQAYPDLAGTRADEKEWIRYWVDRSYLWYSEVPTVTTTGSETTAAYFARLKTSANAASGGLKDRFSFSTSTAGVDNTNAGIVFGYGVRWSAVRSSPPREWIAAVVDPGSPAATAGVRRGDKIVSIDGADFVSGSNTNALNAGLFPSNLGELHTFVLQPADGSAQKSVSLTSASLPLISVPTTGVINTATGRVGYIAFTTFNSFTAEKAIADAIAGFAGTGINDLVLDLRYNGGGYIYISSQLGFMIAGSAKTNGKIFEKTLSNDKKPFGDDDVYPFYNVGSGFTGGVAAGQPLPSLNLNRIFVLTTGGSCSASESFINSLRGINVPVILVGNTTCGKPYGFAGADNCGTTYYPIQFTGVNEKGEGDFVNGFAPTCTVPDDLTKPLGDPTEKQLAAALSYRATGSCPAGTALSVQKRVSADEGDAALAVGVDARALQQLKLTTPSNTRRDRGANIAPREPKDFGEFTETQRQ